MRKLAVLLALCVLLVCFASCGDDAVKDPTPTSTNQPTVTTEARKDAAKEPTKEETKTEAPETPLYDWTQRY